MSNWTPYDLPHLVESLATTNRTALDAMTNGEMVDSPTMRARINEMLHSLDTATFTWLETDLCEVVADTHSTVPEWTPSAVIPENPGIMAFEKPFLHIPESTMPGAALVTVDAIMWDRSGHQMTVTALSRRRGGRIYTSHSILNQGWFFDLVIIAIDADSELGAGTAFTAPSDAALDMVDSFGDAMPAILSTLGAAWLLASQPVIVEDGAPAHTKVRKRHRDSIQPRKTPVRISTKRLTKSTAETSPSGSKRGPATTRWWVRGHWRQQPWGKNRALRKPTFIAPHTAGNRDAEIDNRPQVQVWRK